jgi:hypothetical protein
LNFSNAPAGTQLTDSETASGAAFWLHHIFRGDWSGVSYRFDRIAFSGGETRVHSFFAVNTLDLSHRLTLTAFAGPQYSDNQSVAGAMGSSPVTQSNDWSVAGGVEGGWQNRRTSMSAGYSRSISDGGGILGAVRLQNVYGNFRRQLIPGWVAGLSASHGTNESLIPVSSSSASSINLTSAGVTLNRNLGKNVGFVLGYSHDFQQQLFAPSASPQNLDASRNRFFMTVSYQWAKPLGM